MNAPPKNRSWFRFSLRSLLIVFTLLAVAIGLYYREENAMAHRIDMFNLLVAEGCVILWKARDGTARGGRDSVVLAKPTPRGKLVRPGDKSYRSPWFGSCQRIEIIQLPDSDSPTCRKAIEFYPEADVYLDSDA
jgi:hypothetical protein